MGRNDDVIKCSGHPMGRSRWKARSRIPACWNARLQRCPILVRGQAVKATVLARGFEASDALKKELQTHVKNVTAPYKYPRVVEFVDELPKTVSGKIRRVQIRNEDADK